MVTFYLAVDELLRKHDMPGLGVEYGYRLRLSDLGIVGLATASTHNLAEAIETQIRFLNIISPASRIFYEVSMANKLAVLTLKESDSGDSPHQFMLEAELAGLLRSIRDLLPSAPKSKCTFNLPYPCPTTPRDYRKMTGCPVHFNQQEASLTFPLSWMSKPLQTADSLLAPLLAERCETIMARMEVVDDWVLKVRTNLLTCNTPMQSLAVSAKALNVPVHTLRRHINKCGTSYRQIVLDVRMQLACQYLKDTHLTLQQISYQLGYKQTANFQLAFKKYFKVPPAQWRLA